MDEAIVVRPAVESDARTLLSLVRALAEYEKLDPPDEAAQRRLVRDIFGDRKRLDAFLAEAGGAVIGYALVLETYSSFLALPTLYLEDLFVLPEHRGKMAGSTLFRAVVAEAHRRGCGRVEWRALEWNDLAKEFYRRQGAVALEEWRVWRLTQEKINSL